MVKIIFIESEGKEVIVDAQEGQSILDIAHENNLDLLGTCEGSLVCSTCHIIIDKKHFSRLSAASESEEDCMDLISVGASPYSRLGCQVVVTNEMEGTRIFLPSSETGNIFVEDE